MTKSNDLQRTPEWYDARKGRVTASVAGAILGLSPNMTRADVMRSMVREYFGAESEFTGNIAIDYGTRNEPEALETFKLLHGLDVELCGFIAHEEWLGASPDGLIGKTGLIEIKCPFGLRNSDELKLKPIAALPHYYAQIQIQLLVTGRSVCHFYQWYPKGELYELVHADKEWLDKNLPLLKAFWLEFQAITSSPELAAPHLESLKQVVDTQEAAALLAEYEELCETLDAATLRKKELLDSIVALCDGKNSVVCGKSLTLVSKSGAISYAKAIKELAPNADLEQWRGTASQYWMLR